MEKSNQNKLFLGYVIEASTCLSNIHYSCGLVWFGSVPKMQTANRTEPREFEKENQVRFFAVLVWIALVCGFSIELIRYL